MTTSAQVPDAAKGAGSGGPQFAVAMRGYERGPVDDFVARHRREIARLTADLAEERRSRELAEAGAGELKKQLRDLRARPAPAEAATAGDGFGYRAEKLLRLAEQEASDVRSGATRESAAIIEKARTEAEAHRHEVEQALISRATSLDEQAALRSADLQSREQQVADQLAAARSEAEQTQAAAERAAEQLRAESEAAALETKRRADEEARRQRDQITQEITRLTEVQAAARTELQRLAEMITSQLAGPMRAAKSPADDAASNTPDRPTPGPHGGPAAGEPGA